MTTLRLNSKGMFVETASFTHTPPTPSTSVSDNVLSKKSDTQNIHLPSISIDETYSDEDFLSDIHEESRSDLGPHVLLDPRTSFRIRPFMMEWCFGFDNDLPIFIVANTVTKGLLYVSNNNLVIYDYINDEMEFLQGHQNRICSMSIDRRTQYLVTVDKGADSCIIVWDTAERVPVYTIFDPYPETGCYVGGISPSGRYVVTVGELSEYSVDFWLWTTGASEPTDRLRVRMTRGEPKKIAFNPNREDHVMVVFEHGIVLFVWDHENSKMSNVVFPKQRHKSKIGNLTDGTYLYECHECFASSDQGYVCKFGNTLYSKPYEEGELDNNKIFVNAVKVTEGSVTCLLPIHDCIVIGDSLGRIMFYDNRIKVLFWLVNLPISSVQSITMKLEDDVSFAAQLSSQTFRKHSKNVVGKTASKTLDTEITEVNLDAKDCFVSTVDGNIYAIETWVPKCDPLFYPMESYIGGITAHTERNYIVIACEHGKLYLYDYIERRVITKAMLPEPENKDEDEGMEEVAVVTCIKYCPQSLHLVCGRSNGEIWILDPILLVPLDSKFHASNGKIIKIAFSADSMQFAYFDSRMTTYLFLYNKEEEKWNFRAKTRSHYKEITDIMFYPGIPSTLITLGADRNYVRYNNTKMRDPEEIFEPNRSRIEQSAIPNNMMWYPLYDANTNTGFIMIADNQYKFKLFNDTTLIPHSTALGPAYGCYKSNPVKKMRLVPESEGQYMVYMCKKHIGLQLLPADGNPYRFVGCSAHHEEIRDFDLSFDGKYAFTFGVNDKSLVIWRIKTDAVRQMEKIGGTGLEPYYCLLEGGKNGWLFHEMQDLFYYMQILDQGENTVLPRKVSDMIPVSELPDLVRACGFYPSDFEIESMMIDIKNRELLETNTVREELSFLEFVQLFINHRPPYGYMMEELENAFDTYVMSVDDPDYGSITKENFVETMTSTGEPFNEENLHKCLTILLGEDQEDEEINFDFLPDDIHFDTLVDDILGIDMERKELDVDEEADPFGDNTSDVEIKIP